MKDRLWVAAAVVFVAAYLALCAYLGGKNVGRRETAWYNYNLLPDSAKNEAWAKLKKVTPVVPGDFLVFKDGSVGQVCEIDTDKLGMAEKGVETSFYIWYLAHSRGSTWFPHFILYGLPAAAGIETLPGHPLLDHVASGEEYPACAAKFLKQR